MAKNNINRDDESKPVPSANNGEDKQSPLESVPVGGNPDAEAMRALGDKTDESKSGEEEPGSGTVGDLPASAVFEDGDEGDDIDATSANIDPTAISDGDDSDQGHGTVADIVGPEEIEEEGEAEADIDATIANIDPTAISDSDDSDQGHGTVADIVGPEEIEEEGEAEADIDATIANIDPTAISDSDESDKGSGTVADIDLAVPEENQDVVELDENATVVDLDPTVTFESRNDQRKEAGLASDDGPEGDDSRAGSEQDATLMVDEGDEDEEDIDKTIMEADIDQTVVMDDPATDDSGKDGVPGRPMVGAGDSGGGKPANKKVEATIQDAQEATCDGYGSNPSVNTVDSSVLDSGDVERTINPRELSDEDASAWSLAAQGVAPNAAQTVESGSGPRKTWVDRQFDRLRRSTVSNVKGTQNVDDDYRLVRKLGQGGMGDVFVARQGSLNRLLAVKLIKPLDGEKRAQLERAGRLESVEEERRQQFLSEAIVTGDLDHPNIVPIHDVAVTSNNELFYSMKRVVGTPWSKVIKQNSREENLEILMKSCDAIGFAHERGVVHRDIKPENIMLGDFGVVMVMDWGLALPTSSYDKHDSIFSTSGLGGTPAFMAPEMVTGPLEKIGPASDIYLLGATLVMIITGSAPHQAKNVTECLKSVRRNTIRKVSESKQGELLSIAMRAMATKPEDRYPDVASFQNDIRVYRSHAESISLTVRATEDMELGQREASYAPLSRAAFRYEEALKSWEDNTRAKQGLAATKLVHAKIACDKGDYDFGLSLLDRDNGEHHDLIAKIEAEIITRDSHAARVSLLRKVAVAMLAVIIVGGAGGSLWIEMERRNARTAEGEARTAEGEARTAEGEARTAEGVAVSAQEKAESAEQVARMEKEKAESAEQVALEAEETARESAKQERLAKSEAVKEKDRAEKEKDRAEYEEYISKIALAKARLERNEADGAREILQDLKSNPNSADRTKGWEWRWLWRQANQSEAIGTSGVPVVDLGVSKSGRMGAVALSDGAVQLLRLDVEGKLIEKVSLPPEILAEKRATCVALSADDQRLAIGTDQGEVVIITDLDDLSAAASKVITTSVHKLKVTDICFSNKGTLWTGSEDRTVCSWRQQANGRLVKEAVCWHFLPVKQIAVTEQDQETFLAAVVGDGKTGKVVVWEQILAKTGPVLNLVGRMSEHAGPVSAVTFDRTGRRLASGDLIGNVLVWDRRDVSAQGDEKYRQSIQDAVKKIQQGVATQVSDHAPSTRQIGVPLHDADASSFRRYVSTGVADPEGGAIAKAHSDAVETIRFSGDGKSLLTASDDYTVKVWDLAAGNVRQTLKGHGGWVVGAEFLDGRDDIVVSASDDTTVRTWKPKTYVGAFKSQQTLVPSLTALETNDPKEEIWSASFSPDGTKIVVARGNHKAEVLGIDKASLEFHPISLLSLEEGTDFVAMSMQVDQKHNLVYIGSGDETIRVWDLTRGVQLGEANETGLNTAFALSNDGHWMLSGSSDSNVRAILWQLDPTGRTSPEQVHDLVGIVGQEAISTFAFSPDSKTLFTGDDFGIGILWNAETGEQIGDPVTNVRGSRINDAVFTADGKSLFVAADNAAVTQIDLQTFQNTARFEQLGYVVKMSLSPDGRNLLTVCEVASETSIKTFATLWDLNSGLGKVLDLTVRLRTTETGDESRARITSARFDATNKLVFVSRTANENDNSEIRVWDLKKLTQENGFIESEELKKMTLEAKQSSNTGTVFLMPSVRRDTEGLFPLGDERVLTMNNNGVFLWNLETKQEEMSYRAHAELTEAAFSFDAKYVATASRSVKIWDAVSGKALAKLESKKPIRTVQFSPVKVGDSGYVFATGGDQGVVEFWQFDPETREVIAFAPIPPEPNAGPKRSIQRIRFSTEGDRLWIVGEKGLARLRNLREPTETITLEVPGNQNLTCAAISNDGLHLAAGSSEKNVFVWQLPQQNKDLKMVVLSGHAGVVNDVGLIGNEVETLRVFTASADGTARVWDPRFAMSGMEDMPGVGREIISLRRHQGDVTALDTTENGDLLMTAGRDGTVILWPAETPDHEALPAANGQPEAGKL